MIHFLEGQRVLLQTSKGAKWQKPRADEKPRSEKRESRSNRNEKSFARAIVYSTLLPIRALNCANSRCTIIKIPPNITTQPKHNSNARRADNSFVILYCSRCRSRWQSPNGVYWDIINLTLVHFRSDLPPISISRPPILTPDNFPGSFVPCACGQQKFQ